MKASKRICVIGSGASGIAAIKTCLEYGLEPVCFEKADDIGGLWRYKPQQCDGESSVMKSTVINTSKEMMAYSDFPPPKELPNFMHNRKVMEYFRSYVDRFGLHQYIHFAVSVNRVEKSTDYDATGDWIVRYTTKNGDKEEKFGGVLLCTGHHAEKHVPTFKGQDTFKGKIIHSHQYKDHEGYADRRAVIVGIGNSGGDIAVELSRICQQAYLVTRRGSWILNRVAYNGYPADCVFNRFIWSIFKAFPNFAQKHYEKELNTRFNHENYGLKPQHGVFQAHPTVNDDLPNRILNGTLIVKPNIRELTETGVIFEDGTEADNIDDIVLATGYSFGFPYLQEGVIPVQENEVELFEYMYPAGLKHPSLAVVGLIQPLGAIMPISEMQCRVFADIFTKRSPMPSQEEMRHNIQEKKDDMIERYVKSRRHTIQVDYGDYMDELGALIGANPSYKDYLTSDPVLAWNLLMGPILPYQYRLKD